MSNVKTWEQRRDEARGGAGALLAFNEDYKDAELADYRALAAGVAAAPVSIEQDRVQFERWYESTQFKGSAHAAAWMTWQAQTARFTTPPPCPECQAREAGDDPIGDMQREAREAKLREFVGETAVPSTMSAGYSAAMFRRLLDTIVSLRVRVAELDLASNLAIELQNMAQSDAEASERARIAQSAPAGWKLVPVKANEDMYIRGDEATCGYVDWESDSHTSALERSEMIDGIWEAMLAAAPTPPAQPAPSDPLDLPDLSAAPDWKERAYAYRDRLLVALEALAELRQAQPAPDLSTPLDDRKIADAVNKLREIAIQFHAAGQLRERIAGVIVPLLKSTPAAPSDARDAQGGGIVSAADKELLVLAAKGRPILFSAPMVRALLDGSKTQTRRLVKPQPQMVTEHQAASWEGDPAVLLRLLDMNGKYCPYGQPGDRLWVRETFAVGDGASYDDGQSDIEYLYRASCSAADISMVTWKPSIHMPRAASRILLEIVSVRVERLSECSDADAVAEGCTKNHNGYYWGGPHAISGTKQMATARKAYRDLWESINGAGSWAANPWVWVVEFRAAAAIGETGA